MWPRFKAMTQPIVRLWASGATVCEPRQAAQTCTMGRVMALKPKGHVRWGGVLQKGSGERGVLWGQTKLNGSHQTPLWCGGRGVEPTLLFEGFFVCFVFWDLTRLEENLLKDEDKTMGPPGHTQSGERPLTAPRASRPNQGSDPQSRTSERLRKLRHKRWPQSSSIYAKCAVRRKMGGTEAGCCQG